MIYQANYKFHPSFFNIWFVVKTFIYEAWSWTDLLKKLPKTIIFCDSEKLKCSLSICLTIGLI